MGKGICLDIARESNETLVGTKGGVIRCYSTQRLPAEEKWQNDLVLGMRGTPQQPNPNKRGLRVPIRLGLEGDELGEASGPSQTPPEGEIPPIPEEIPDTAREKDSDYL